MSMPSQHFHPATRRYKLILACTLWYFLLYARCSYGTRQCKLLCHCDRFVRGVTITYWLPKVQLARKVRSHSPNPFCPLLLKMPNVESSSPLHVASYHSLTIYLTYQCSLTDSASHLGPHLFPFAPLSTGDSHSVTLNPGVHEHRSLTFSEYCSPSPAAERWRKVVWCYLMSLRMVHSPP